MSDRAVLPAPRHGGALSDARVVRKAAMSLWAYSAVCGGVAVSAGYSAGVAFAAILPAHVVRTSVIALIALTGGLNGPRVLTQIEKRLGLLPDLAAAESWVKQANAR
jgi:hypothetical protein